MTITITDTDKLKCVEREIKMRMRVYPLLVTRGKMDSEKATRELETMIAIADDYRALTDLFAANTGGRNE